MPRQAFKLEAEVGADGKLALELPLPHGSRVEVVVLTQEVDDCSDLVAAANSSTDFWDNSIDDAEWNNA
jgi:hypothetical protein